MKNTTNLAGISTKLLYYIQSSYRFNEPEKNDFLDHIKNGEIKNIQLMINSGFDCNFSNNYSITVACDYGQLEIMKLLIAKTSNPIQFKSLLSSAISHDQLEVSQYLITKYNLDINSIDSNLFVSDKIPNWLKTYQSYMLNEHLQKTLESKDYVPNKIKI